LCQPARISPGHFVELVEQTGCQGTSISFNEPTLSLEWSLEVFRLARRQGLYNTYVTNGYMTPEALCLLLDAGLDAMNADVKGDSLAVRHYCKAVDVEKVWAVSRLARQRGVHVEITTLVIPNVNDCDTTLRGIAERIVTGLGPEAPCTPIGVLERAWEIGKEAGLAFVCVGNIAGHRYEHTYCPACGMVLIRRSGFDVMESVLRGSECPRCGQRSAGLPTGYRTRSVCGSSWA
jgi:pyruvate formate lyase activating enzyme